VLKLSSQALCPGADGAVIVCGAGAAGLAAALAAAKGGASVLLVEASSSLGGTVAGAFIHTLAGFYDSAGKLTNEGLPAELVQRLLTADSRTRERKMGRTWVLQVCPRVYRDAVTRWIGSESHIAVLRSAAVTRVLTAGRRIDEVEIAAPLGTFRIHPRAVVDATGTAEVTRLLDPSLVLDDSDKAVGGWIFRLNNVAAGALQFPRGLGLVRDLRAKADAGLLPPECRHVWLDAGSDDHEVYVKLFVPIGPDWRGPNRLGEIVRGAKATQAAVVECLRKNREFAEAEVSEPEMVGVRDGGRIRGRYTLTGDDVRQGRKFPDAAGRCAWPIEFWDAERGVQLEYLPEGTCYDIPMRALELPHLDNFWAAGKCLSADRLAHASARVVGACWAMGQAAGAAAARQPIDQEQQDEHEPVRAVSSDRAPAAGIAGRAWAADECRPVVPRA
jgi:hypothetical protein